MASRCHQVMGEKGQGYAAAASEVYGIDGVAGQGTAPSILPCSWHALDSMSIDVIPPSRLPSFLARVGVGASVMLQCFVRVQASSTGEFGCGREIASSLFLLSITPTTNS